MSLYGLQPLFIHGVRVDSDGNDRFSAVNPATGEVIAQLQEATAGDIERAVTSAQHGQREWAAMTAMQRARVLQRAVAILRERNDELALMETHDTGKPLAETRTVDIATGADVLEYYAGLAPSLEGQQIRCATCPLSIPGENRWA